MHLNAKKDNAKVLVKNKVISAALKSEKSVWKRCIWFITKGGIETYIRLCH